MESADGSGAPTIKRLSSCLIPPASPTPPHCMFLSVFDIVERFYPYIPLILIYPVRVPNAFGEAVACLKASLSKALVAFYPWAGRLFEQADGRLALDCNDAGVEFVEASIDLPFSSLQENNFEHQPFFEQFCSLAHVLQWTSPDLPLLSIQVTKFLGDEGMVLGFTSCHVVADGTSVMCFLKSLADCVRGLEISMAPRHMREELGPEKLILPSTISLEGLSCTHGGKLDLEWPAPKELRQCKFYFSTKKLMKLKEIGGTDIQSCSTFQALVAHIWKRVSIARGVITECENYGLGLVRDFRDCLNPPLPQAYFGNAIMRHVIRANTMELQNESLVETVKRIQDAIYFMDDHLFKSFGGTLEVVPTWILQKEHVDLQVPTLEVSGSPRFPFYTLDYGWGKPLCVNFPCIQGDGEFYLVLGPEDKGGIEVSLSLNKLDMDRINMDEGI